jgi:hypothetical protein
MRDEENRRQRRYRGGELPVIPDRGFDARRDASGLSDGLYGNDIHPRLPESRFSLAFSVGSSNQHDLALQNVIELPTGNGEQDGMVEQLPASVALQKVIELPIDKEQQDGIDEQWQLVSRSTSQSDRDLYSMPDDMKVFEEKYD